MWIDLKNIILSEVHQTETIVYAIIYMRNQKNTSEPIYTTETDSQT